MANKHYADQFYDNAARQEVSRAIVNKKVNVCPFTVRLAWHSSGTFDKSDATGGSNGATMRFAPEISDSANACLDFMQYILKPVKRKFPDLSYADLFTMAGVQAVKLTGGPDVPYRYGRTDATDNAQCPDNGRLPDASQGAQHLRDVFYRMGFDDKDIVVLSGAHTLGACHRMCSGFDGFWTTNPLKFDNEYYQNLLDLAWTPRDWDGPMQYQDPSGQLMMLPTDMTLVEDEKFRPYVELYAKDEAAFFADFAEAFGRLLALGCPEHVQPGNKIVTVGTDGHDEVREFHDLAMHGSLERMKDMVAGKNVDVNAVEPHIGRTALHKAAFFGHAQVVNYLISLGANVNLADNDGDTPLHDAAYFGHVTVVESLVRAGAHKDAVNMDGATPKVLAERNEKSQVLEKLGS